MRQMGIVSAVTGSNGLLSARSRGNIVRRRIKSVSSDAHRVKTVWAEPDAHTDAMPHAEMS